MRQYIQQNIRKIENIFTVLKSSILENPSINNETKDHTRRYLIIATYGTLEDSLKYIYEDYLKTNAPSDVQNFISAQLKRIYSWKYDPIRKLSNSINTTKATRIINLFKNKKTSTAIESLIGLRDKIAHGNPDPITLTSQTVTEYKKAAIKLIKFVDNVFI